MTKYLIFFLLCLFSVAAVSASEESDSELLQTIQSATYEYAKYAKDDAIPTVDRLIRVENDIAKLGQLAEAYPHEPRVYYVIRELYSLRDLLLKRKIYFKERAEWFSLPVVQENLQGIRDNCDQMLISQGLGKGVLLEEQMIRNCTTSVVSIQFMERGYKAMHKMLPDVIECKESDDPYDECMTQYKKDIVLRDYLDVQNEYIVYGFFDDAERLNNEIAQVSEEGKAASIEKAARIERARQNFNPDKYKDDIDYALMQPGGTPKPITIKAVDAIAEFQKAQQEKERLVKEAEASSSSSVQQSSAPSTVPSVPVQQASEIDKDKLLWIGIAIGVVLLILLVLFRRRKS